MRTDVKVRRSGEVRLPNIPLVGSRKSWASAGDFIQFKVGGYDNFGRVIGFVNPPEDPNSTLIVVLMLSSTGCLWERWVRPEDVVDCSGFLTLRTYYAKLQWYFSEAFEMTPPDVARNAFNLTVDELREACSSTAFERE